MKKRIISVHGSYFAENYGDILLVNMFSDWVKEADPSVIINLPMVDKRKTPEMPESKTGLLNLIRSEKLVFCGGGYFGEQPKNKRKWALRNFYRHGIVALIALVFRVPYIFVGVEFGPISAAWFRNFTIFIAKRAQRVVVRNEESKLFLEKYGVNGVELTVDAVLSLSDRVKPIDTSNNSKKIVLLHLSQPNLYKIQYTSFINELCKYIKNSKVEYELHLFFDTPENLSNYDFLINILKSNNINCCIDPYVNTRKVIDLINNASYVFTSKLHVGITSASLNTPVFSFYAHPKTPRLHKQIGNSEFCYPLKNFLISGTTLRSFFIRTSFVLPELVLQEARKNKQIVTSFVKM